MFAGFTGQENAPVYLPPPLFLSVPIVTPVDVTSTLSVALVLVLFASTFRILLATTYSATLMVTVSADGGGGGGGGGAGGVTVSAAVLLTAPAVAVIVAELDAVTATVVTVNVALVVPAAKVTLPSAGTLATAELLLESVTTIPPVGAADVSVTVPVEDAGPTTVAGLSVSVESVAGGGGGVTVSTAVLVTVPAVAVMVAELDAVTATVVTVNGALVAPAAMVTLPAAGTLATVPLLLESVTTIPPAGAAEVSVTVPVEEAGPTTLVGLSVRLESVPGGVGVLGVQPDNVACAELPPPLTDTTHVAELKG